VEGRSEKEILGFHLLIDGKSVYQKVGKKSNDLEWRTWDLRKYLGKKAKVKWLINERVAVGLSQRIISFFPNFPPPRSLDLFLIPPRFTAGTGTFQ
jgi:hypothetical protein